MSQTGDAPHDERRRIDGRLQNPHLLIAGAVVLASLIALFVSQRRVPITDTIDAQQRAGAIESRIDPNVATYAELTALPGIGPVMAERIVEYRRQQAQAHRGDGLAFRAAEDLAGVRGIGPKTVEKLRPWLRFDGSPGPD